MIAVSKKISIFLSAMAVLVLCASAVNAQSGSSGYGTTRTNEFKFSNSSSRHNVESIQTRLDHNSITRNRFSPRTPPARKAASRSAAKPFSSISRGPSVSPYLALSNPRSQASDYYNIIKPQREQRRLNQQQQRVNQQLLRQNMANQHRLNQMAAVGPFDPKGSELIAPTGHTAVYQQLGNYLNFGGYFPPPSKPKNE